MDLENLMIISLNEESNQFFKWMHFSIDIYENIRPSVESASEYAIILDSTEVKCSPYFAFVTLLTTTNRQGYIENRGRLG